MKIIATNKRARFDYAIESTLLAGIILTGPETKSARLGHVQLKGSYVQILGNELFLINTHISPYSFAKGQPHEDTRSRKLLVNKKELDQLTAAKQQGRHLFPVSIGIRGRFIKVEIGIGASKKLHDKREIIKKRDKVLDQASAM